VGEAETRDMVLEAVAGTEVEAIEIIGIDFYFSFLS